MNHEVLEKANANREEAKRLAEEIIELQHTRPGWKGYIKKLFVRRQYQVCGESCTKGRPDYCITLTEEDLNALVSVRDEKLKKLNEEFFSLDGSPEELD